MIILKIMILLITSIEVNEPVYTNNEKELTLSSIPTTVIVDLGLETRKNSLEEKANKPMLLDNCDEQPYKISYGAPPYGACPGGRQYVAGCTHRTRCECSYTAMQCFDMPQQT